MEKVPDWMKSITVQYACNNCPNRQTKNIAFVNLDPAIPAAAKIDIEDGIDEVADDAEPEVEV